MTTASQDPRFVFLMQKLTPEQQRSLWENRDRHSLPDDVAGLLTEHGFKPDWERTEADGHIVHVMPEWLRDGLDDELWRRPFEV
jgi:hypothetical protein